VWQIWVEVAEARYQPGLIGRISRAGARHTLVFVLMDVNLSNLVGQDALHSGLNRHRADAGSSGRILDILVVRHWIVAGDDDQVRSRRRAASEKANALVCEWMRS